MAAGSNATDRPSRDSNFELLRIFAMFMIIAHHYVVNSGLSEMFDLHNVTGNMVFLQFFGFGGKMAINIFTLLTGYFMVGRKLKARKILQLWLEVIFYDWLINIVFIVTGYADVDFSYIAKQVFPFRYFYEVDKSYVSSLLTFYFLIPCLNIVCDGCEKKMYRRMLVVTLVVYSVVRTFCPWNQGSGQYVSWFCIVYLLGGYVKLYPCSGFESKTVAIVGAVGSIGLIFASILVVDFVGVKFGFEQYYYMATDANKLLCIIGGVSLFLLAKNIRVKSSKFINASASATFGVLLLHAHSDTMRQFLWKDVFRNTEFYTSPYLPIIAIGSVALVYCICVPIDLLRIKFIEKPLFTIIGKRVKGF